PARAQMASRLGVSSPWAANSARPASSRAARVSRLVRARRRPVDDIASPHLHAPFPPANRYPKNPLTYELVCESNSAGFGDSTACARRGVDMRPTRWTTGLGARAACALAGLLVCGMLAAPAAQGASSRDYPGPCIGETNAVGVPLYLAADYHGTNPVFGVVILSDTGRFKLGISCVATGFVVVHVGPDSALCTVRGLCTPDQLMGLTQADIEAVQGIPNEVPFFHICQKHGFGWYDAVNVPAGIYVAIADSQSGFFGLVDGHGTMDTYAFVGNGGAFQPVNCQRPPVCGNFVVEPGETCDDGNTVAGDCCSATCTVEPAGSACAGVGDLCTPGVCDGAGTCLHENACVDE